MVSGGRRPLLGKTRRIENCQYCVAAAAGARPAGAAATSTGAFVAKTVDRLLSGLLRQALRLRSSP